MNTRLLLVIAALAGISFSIPAAAEEVGVGVTVGSDHDEGDRVREKTVIRKDHDADDKKVVIKKDRDHDGDVDKKVVIKKDHDRD